MRLTIDLNSAKRELLLAALISSPTVKRAAEAAGVPETTVYNWLRREDFAEEYRKRKRQAVSEASDFLQSRINEAAQVITGLMNDTKVSPRTRLDAARSIIEFGYRIYEQAEVIARIEALEDSLGDSGQ